MNEKSIHTKEELHIAVIIGHASINELIPVMENLAAIGVPGFPQLSKLLDRFKNTVSKEEEEK